MGYGTPSNVKATEHRIWVPVLIACVSLTLGVVGLFAWRFHVLQKQQVAEQAATNAVKEKLEENAAYLRRVLPVSKFDFAIALMRQNWGAGRDRSVDCDDWIIIRKGRDVNADSPSHLPVLLSRESIAGRRLVIYDDLEVEWVYWRP